jgi:hypothetical protein
MLILISSMRWDLFLNKRISTFYYNLYQQSKKKRENSKTWLGGEVLAKFVVCLAPSAILVNVTKYMKNEIYLKIYLKLITNK